MKTRSTLIHPLVFLLPSHLHLQALLAYGNIIAFSRELENDGKSSEGPSTPLGSETEALIGKYGAGDGKGENLDGECRQREPRGMVEVAKSEWDRTG